MIARTRTQYRIILNMKFNNKLVQRKKGGKNERGSWFITSDLDNSMEIIKDDDFPLRPDRRPKYFMFTMVLNTSLWIYATISRYMFKHNQRKSQYIGSNIHIFQLQHGFHINIESGCSFIVQIYKQKLTTNVQVIYYFIQKMSSIKQQ